MSPLLFGPLNGCSGVGDDRKGALFLVQGFVAAGGRICVASPVTMDEVARFVVRGARG